MSYRKITEKRTGLIVGLIHEDERIAISALEEHGYVIGTNEEDSPSAIAQLMPCVSTLSCSTSKKVR